MKENPVDKPTAQFIIRTLKSLSDYADAKGVSMQSNTHARYKLKSAAALMREAAVYMADAAYETDAISGKELQDWLAVLNY